jgi:hypothetical protein
MGVMLSLEGARQSTSRRRRGQHSRTTEDQACLDALAAFLRSDASTACRCLSRVPAESLAGRLLPAARALAQAAGLVLAAQGAAGRSVELDYGLSAPCLLGHCADAAAQSPCPSVTCQHSCHGRPQALIYSAGTAGQQA